MTDRDVLPQIHMRKTRKMRVEVDHGLYRLRNMVERCFNKLKNAPRVAPLFDKTAESYLGFFDIASIEQRMCHWQHDLETVEKIGTGLRSVLKRQGQIPRSRA